MDCREKNEKKAFLRKLFGGISFRGLSFRGLSFRGLRFRYTPTHQKFGNAMLMTSSLLNENPTYDFFQYIDSLHPKTKFTMETEENSQLPFLDTLIQRNRDNTISVRVYRKPTHTDQYLKFTSHHIARAKKSVVTSLFDRAKNIISNPSDQEKEKNHLTAVLQADGYSRKFIKNTIRASQNNR